MYMSSLSLCFCSRDLDLSHLKEKQGRDNVISKMTQGGHRCVQLKGVWKTRVSTFKQEINN